MFIYIGAFTKFQSSSNSIIHCVMKIFKYFLNSYTFITYSILSVKHLTQIENIMKVT